MTRYQRQIQLPEVGEAGQKRLQASHVACVGVGGLGAPATLYLAAAGVGQITLIDDDTIALSNLHRQILYETREEGQRKVMVAAKRLFALNPTIKIHTHAERLTEDNAKMHLSTCSVVLDGSDNFTTRYSLNDICYTLQKPLIHASVQQWKGQCTVFLPPKTPCYRCVFPSLKENRTPNCRQVGVIGPVAGLLGLLQATEAIKSIVQAGEGLLGRMLRVDALTMRFDQWELTADPACVLCGQVGEWSSNVAPKPSAIPSLSAKELAMWQHNRPESFQLLDVREPDERAQGFIEPSLWIPLGQLPQATSKLDRNTCYVVYCKRGSRSLKATRWLRGQGFTQLYNLEGGILDFHAFNCHNS